MAVASRDFEIYNYGPFCSAILSDVEWLQADGIVNDENTISTSSSYTATESTEELKQQFGDALEKYGSTISSVVAAFCSKTAEQLELDATLDFSFRWVRARGGEGPCKEAAIAKFIEIKKDKFAKADIDSAYDNLVGMNLITA